MSKRKKTPEKPKNTAQQGFAALFGAKKRKKEHVNPSESLETKITNEIFASRYLATNNSTFHSLFD